jgi:hypothetical protein
MVTLESKELSLRVIVYDSMLNMQLTQRRLRKKIRLFLRCEGYPDGNTINSNSTSIPIDSEWCKERMLCHRSKFNIYIL